VFVLNPAIYGRVFTLAADAPTLAGSGRRGDGSHTRRCGANPPHHRRQPLDGADTRTAIFKVVNV